MHKLGFWLGICVSLGLIVSPAAAVVIIDFEEFAHGEVIGGSNGHGIVTDNINKPFDLGVVFDTRLRGTSDPDLEGPNGVDAVAWSGGNLATNTILGNALIIQENNTGCSSVGDICTNPDDEGQRPAGDFTITFSSTLDDFGFDIIDVEGLVENGSITFLDGISSVTLDFSDFMAGGSHDQGAVFGNNTANRVSPITALSLGLVGIDSVVIAMAGSGAITNLSSTIPEPALLGLVGLALAGALRRH